MKYFKRNNISKVIVIIGLVLAVLAFFNMDYNTLKSTFFPSAHLNLSIAPVPLGNKLVLTVENPSDTNFDKISIYYNASGAFEKAKIDFNKIRKGTSKTAYLEAPVNPNCKTSPEPIKVKVYEYANEKFFIANKTESTVCMYRNITVRVLSENVLVKECSGYYGYFEGNLSLSLEPENLTINESFVLVDELWTMPIDTTTACTMGEFGLWCSEQNVSDILFEC